MKIDEFKKDDFNSFGKRLKYLRETNNLSQLDIYFKINIDRALISRYERDLDLPTKHQLEKFKDLFDENEFNFLRTSLDYENKKNGFKNNYLFDRKQFAVRLKKVRALKKLSQVDLANISGIYHGTIAKYERCYSIPNLENAILLADSLGTTVDLLLRGTNVNTNQRSLIDSSLIQTFNQLSKCSLEQKKAIILILDAAVNNLVNLKSR